MASKIQPPPAPPTTVAPERRLARQVAPHPLDNASAETLVRQMSNWEVFAPEADDVLAAIALCRKAGIGFWDAMILHSATELGCDVVWSEDLNAGQSDAGVVVRSPFEPAR